MRRLAPAASAIRLDPNSSETRTENLYGHRRHFVRTESNVYPFRRERRSFQRMEFIAHHDSLTSCLTPHAECPYCEHNTQCK